jgi:polysaccharide export outer membrane protein
MGSKTWLRFAALIAAAVFSVPSHAADYAPRPGDVLDITVSGAPVLNRRVTVSTESKITYPVLGQVDVADHPLNDIKQLLQDMLASRNVVQHPDVIVAVAEYGPIYVSGDVLRPGEFHYRPNMTVGNAIALAGEFDLTQNEPHVTSAQLSEARAQLGEAALEYTRQQVRIARLEAELSGAQEVEPEATENSVDPTIRARIIEIETAQLLADHDADAREKAHLKQMVIAARGELTALEADEQQHQQSFDVASQGANRARDLVGKGVGTMYRSEDADRALSVTQGQLLEVRVRAAQARKELQERTRNLEIFDDHRRTKLLQTLTDSVAEAGKVRFRMESARDRLGREVTDRPRQSDVIAKATIRRQVDGETVAIAATTDTKLQTGDALEIVADMTPRRATASK